MASLVLGVAGAVIAPFFGIPPNVGFMIGSAIGGALFPDKGPDGPKLADLKVQDSQYGSPIPIVYGSYRVAGNVIWSTKLIQHANEADSGSGGGGMTLYTYTVSFAVGICEGPIIGIARIWADGKLVYNKLADRPGNGIAFNAGAFRIYLGSNTQMPDPRIEVDRGVGNVPAHRGMAYIVFEDFELAKFGNRVPNLTFEVVTVGSTDGDIISPTPIPVADVLANISSRCALPTDRLDTTDIKDMTRGYAITVNGPGRSMVEPIMQAYLIDAVESDRVVRYIKRGRDSLTVINAEELMDTENQ